MKIDTELAADGYPIGVHLEEQTFVCDKCGSNLKLSKADVYYCYLCKKFIK